MGMAWLWKISNGPKRFAIFTRPSIFGSSGPSFGAIAKSAMHQSVIGPAEFDSVWYRCTVSVEVKSGFRKKQVAKADDKNVWTVGSWSCCVQHVDSA